MKLTQKFLAAAVLVSCVALGAPPTMAYPGLAFSLPPAKSVQPLSPSEIVLTFSEVVKPLMCKLVDGHGNVLSQLDGSQPAAQTFRVPISGILADGNYSVGYRIDVGGGQDMVGAFDFSVHALKPKKPHAHTQPPA